MEEQVKSKQRVADHGEVLTGKREVKPSQHVTRKVYTFVPIQNWTKQWTDKDLYAKYSLSASEIAFIESVVRPMPAGTEDADKEASDE